MGCHLMCGYLQFLRLGREGYTKIMKNLGLVAARLQKGIEATGQSPLAALTMMGCFCARASYCVCLTASHFFVLSLPW